MNDIKIKGNTIELQTEIKLLRSFVIGLAGRDKEGEYRPEFVNRVLGAVNEKPTALFTDSKQFLRQLQK